MNDEDDPVREAGSPTLANGISISPPRRGWDLSDDSREVTLSALQSCTVSRPPGDRPSKGLVTVSIHPQATHSDHPHQETKKRRGHTSEQPKRRTSRPLAPQEHTPQPKGSGRVGQPRQLPFQNLRPAQCAHIDRVRSAMRPRLHAQLAMAGGPEKEATRQFSGGKSRISRQTRPPSSDRHSSDTQMERKSSGSLRVSRNRAREDTEKEMCVSEITNSDPRSRASTCTTNNEVPGRYTSIAIGGGVVFGTWLTGCAILLLLWETAVLSPMDDSWKGLRLTKFNTNDLVVIAVSLGGGIMSMFVKWGSNVGFVSLTASVGRHIDWHRAGHASVLAMLVAIAVVAVHVGFVLIARSFSTTLAAMAGAILFVMFHEVVCRTVTPILVFTLSDVSNSSNLVLNPTSSHETAAIVWFTAIILMLFNSVFAPVLASAITSDYCFSDCNLTMVDDKLCDTFPDCLQALWRTGTLSLTSDFQQTKLCVHCGTTIATIYTPTYVTLLGLRVFSVLYRWVLSYYSKLNVFQSTCSVFSVDLNTDSKELVSSARRTPSKDRRSKPDQCVASSNVSEDTSDPKLRRSRRHQSHVVAVNATQQFMTNIQPTVEMLNVFALLIGPGLLSPVVGFASVATLGFEAVGNYSMARMEARPPKETLQTFVPVPVLCVALLLLSHCACVMVLFSVSESGWAGVACAATSFAMFTASCWRCTWSNGTSEHVASKDRHSTYRNARRSQTRMD